MYNNEKLRLYSTISYKNYFLLLYFCSQKKIAVKKISGSATVCNHTKSFTIIVFFEYKSRPDFSTNYILISHKLMSMVTFVIILVLRLIKVSNNSFLKEYNHELLSDTVNWTDYLKKAIRQVIGEQ